MIRSISGKVLSVGEAFAVIDVHGIGLKVAMPKRSLAALPARGELVELFTHLNVKEDALDLYGFRHEDELGFFELLISVGGVGPKSALAILDVADLKDLAAAIKENRPDLLTRAGGIGQKTAERIILELRNKVQLVSSDKTVRRMDADSDITETLVSLGYRKEQAKAALDKVDQKTIGVEARLKAALAILSGRG